MENDMKILIASLVALATPAMVMAQSSAPADSAAPMEHAKGDMSTAPSTKAEESKARNSLTEAGYTNINHLRQDGNEWAATATRNGKVMKLHVTQEGRVTVDAARHMN